MSAVLALWLPIALAAVLTAVAMYENVRARRAIQTVLFVVAAVMLTAAITWDIAGRVIASPRHPSGSLQKQVMKSWGTNAPICITVIDGSGLTNFQDAYVLAVACGIQDATIDKFEDTRIALSSSFSIHPGDITIAVQHSKEMNETTLVQIGGESG